MTTKHTPGPWRVSDQNDESVVTAVGDFYWFHWGHLPHQPEQYGINPKADARLIAAAPDLLAACQRFAALLPLLRTLTVRQVIEAGDDAIDAAGLNPYCINEGLAEGSEPAISEWKLDEILDAIAKATGAQP